MNWHSLRCVPSAWRVVDSPERERERFDASIEKLDLELAVVNRPRLPNQLIQPLLGHPAITVVVDISAMCRARRLLIDEHAEAHGRSARCWSQDEVEITRVKSVRDPSPRVIAEE